MEITGHGVYLLDREVAQTMPCHPTEIDPSYAVVAFGALAKGLAAVRILSFSRSHNAWVGVTLPRLIAELRKYHPDRFIEVRNEIMEMIKDGLLTVRLDQKGFLSCWFSKEVVCPTPEFALRAMEVQLPPAKMAV